VKSIDLEEVVAVVDKAGAKFDLLCSIDCI
jgi:hypothetical protein